MAGNTLFTLRNMWLVNNSEEKGHSPAGSSECTASLTAQKGIILLLLITFFTVNTHTEHCEPTTWAMPGYRRLAFIVLLTFPLIFIHLPSLPHLVSLKKTSTLSPVSTSTVAPLTEQVPLTCRFSHTTCSILPENFSVNSVARTI